MTGLPVETLPQPLDVVWCRFPYAEKPGVPGVVPHPGLIFATGRSARGDHVVQVAYGTSNLKPNKRPFDFRLTNYRGMGYAGLYAATRFDLDRIKWLLWDDEWFESQDPARFATPVIGHLQADAVARLNACLRLRQARGLSVPFCPKPQRSET